MFCCMYYIDPPVEFKVTEGESLFMYVCTYIAHKIGNLTVEIRKTFKYSSWFKIDDRLQRHSGSFLVLCPKKSCGFGKSVPFTPDVVRVQIFVAN